MLFPTHEFGLFLLVVVALLGVVRRHAERRKAVLLAANLIFYASWDWRFIALLLLSVVVNHTLARQIDRFAPVAQRRQALLAGVAYNLLVLGFFKYQGFFVSSLQDLLTSLGLRVQLPILEVVLPVGLSFYTFRAISYLVDVYRRDMVPARSLLDWAVCLTFFPYLVAGPIVRPRDFLPQLRDAEPRYGIPADLALALILGGLFKKVVIANTLQQGLVDPVFQNPAGYARSEVLLATYGYAVQIYCDFSAYSDMAIGAALLLGFRSAANFDAPYRSQSLQEFWRRWHITLSSWLRDYLYIPLGGSRCSPARTQVNLAATMLLGGLWHGAAWTFIVWGALHGFGLAAERAWLLPKRGRGPVPLGVQVLRVVGTFHFVCLTWIFFRAESFAAAMAHLRALVVGGPAPTLMTPALWVMLLLGMALHYLPTEPLASARRAVAQWPLWAQGVLAGSLLALLRAFWPDGMAPFIYAGF